MSDFEKHKKNFLDFLHKLTPNKKVGIIAHNACIDGMASVLFLEEILKSLYPNMPVPLIYFINYSTKMFDPVKSKMREGGIKDVFILDVAADESLDEFERFREEFNVLFVDHHVPNVKLKFDNKIIKTEGADCTSLTLYRFGEKLFDREKWTWLMCSAAISEFSHNKEENLQYLQKFYPKITRENIRSSEPFVTSIGIGSTLIYYRNDTFKAYKLIKELDFKTIKEIHSEVSKEIEKKIDGFSSKAKFYPEYNLYMYEFSSKFDIGSSLSTILSIKHLGSNIILFSSPGEKQFVKVSARNNGKPLPLSMKDILQAGIQGLEQSTAGGHHPASGGSFLRKDMDKFKEQVLAFLEKKNGQ